MCVCVCVCINAYHLHSLQHLKYLSLLKLLAAQNYYLETCLPILKNSWGFKIVSCPPLELCQYGLLKNHEMLTPNL